MTVWNTDLNCPCIEIDDVGNVIGSAIFADIDGGNEEDARRWAEKYFTKDFMKKEAIKVLPVTISFTPTSK